MSDKDLLRKALDALVGYRREMRLMLGDEESQPCDAEQAIRAHLAQPQGEPAWHDAPNAPGLWVVGSRCLHINELDLPIYKDSRCRWYGPIPEDKP